MLLPSKVPFGGLGFFYPQKKNKEAVGARSHNYK
jgi:hypothetical protein